MTATPDEVPDADRPEADDHDADRSTDAHALVELVAACQARIAALHAVQAGAVGALLTTPEFTLPPTPDEAAAGAARGEPLVEDLVAELAARLTLTTSAAGALVSTAERLTRCLPATLTALAAGRTDWARARVVVDECLLLTDDQARYLDEEVTDDVTTTTTGALRARLRSRIDRLDPDAVRRRARRAVADRSVRYHPVGDGIAEMLLRGPATDLRCAYEHLTSLAKDTTRPGASTDPHAATVHATDGTDGTDGPGDAGGPARRDQRGLDAKRFDAAISALTAPCPDAPGIGAGAGPQLFVHLSTALGLDEATGELIRHGPLPASHVRTLLADHRFRRVLTDAVTGVVTAVDGHSHPPGTIPDLTQPAALGDSGSSPFRRRPRPDQAARGTSHHPSGGAVTPPSADLVPSRGRDDSAPTPGQRTGTGTAGTISPSAPAPAAPRGAHPPCPVAAAGGGAYAIPAGTQRLVRVRSRRCTAPGCRVPATRCDSDHVLEWPEGPTCPCNVVPLCRRHHDLKTRRRWRLRKTTDDPRDATVTWTTVLGYRYTVRAEPLLPERPDDGADAPPPSPRVTDRLSRHYDRGYPADHDEPPPEPTRGTGATGGTGTRSSEPAIPPRRTWVDLPDGPPY